MKFKPLSGEVVANAPPRCPVCGQVTYSAAGIHPQCAMNRSSQAHDARVKVEAARDTTKRQATRSWLKACPRCQRQLPIRRGACECGHVFPTATKSV